MGGPPEGSVSVVIEEDIRLTPRTAVAGKGRLMPEKKIREEVFQLVSMEGDSSEEEEIVLCKTVMEAADLVPILLVNQASKIVKMKKSEEVGRALPLRTLQRVKLKERCM